MLALAPAALAQPGSTIALPEPQGQTLLLQSVDRADYGPLADLWRAMRTTDSSSGRNRGLVVLRRI